MQMNWMVGIVIATILIWAMSVGARIDDPVDESKPELVKMYVFFPCDALDESYDFQYEQLTHLTGHLISCHKEANDNPDFKYGKLMCLYVEMQWQLMYDHAKSVEKAWQLTCDDHGRPLNPQYEVDF
jgi:hypothetical protein